MHPTLHGENNTGYRSIHKVNRTIYRERVNKNDHLIFNVKPKPVTAVYVKPKFKTNMI